MPVTDDLADDLASAVRTPEIFAVYQPQVSLESGSIVGAEALCRWRHPQRGDIDPATMIGVAERSGVIHALGRRMLDECLDTLAEWRETGREWAVAVNVSPRQFEDPAFVPHVASELTRRALPPASLVLELTQAARPVDDGALLPQLRALREAGVEISLDGYGGGSLAREQWQSLPLTEVKVPGHLVRAAERDDLAPLRHEVEVAHAHGLRVVAGGIETLTHLDVAVALGCDRAQGFLIRQPDSEIVLP
ncbi:EAL domain-containing protein [Microbacterium sp. NPDC056044]|uniref:EAL domain-containing protein n=1 Tax=Microbacterium sp. NPDC056044 TaxID=3345690 RepID=UPI0035E2B347